MAPIISFLILALIVGALPTLAFRIDKIRGLNLSWSEYSDAWFYHGIAVYYFILAIYLVIIK